MTKKAHKEMVENKKEKTDKQQRNKGVNTSPNKTNKDKNYFSDTDSYVQSVGATKSIAKVKNDLQTVIDLMGPNTPQFLQSSSNDGDNELSVTTELTDKPSDKQNQEEPSVAYSEDTTDKTLPPDITLQEDTDISIVADKNSTTFEFPQYVCPPPPIPANIIYNSECMCPQVANYIRGGASSMIAGSQKEYKKYGRHKNALYNFFKSLTSNLTEKTHEYYPGNCEYYTMNVKESRNGTSRPKGDPELMDGWPFYRKTERANEKSEAWIFMKLVFELVGDGPKRDFTLDDEFIEPHFCQTLRSGKAKDLKNFNNEQLTREVHQHESLPPRRESLHTFEKSTKKLNQKTMHTENSGATRVDVYYFDHGDCDYLKTTDSPPVVTTETLAERTEAYTTRFWAEIFGTLHIGVSFGISFVLQFFRFFLYSLLRPLTVGLVQLATDYFLKPCIATLFNAVIQPPLILLFNICASLRDVCRPIAEGIGFFTREITSVIRAFRIVDVRREKISDKSSSGEKKEKVEEKVEKAEIEA